MRGSRYSHSSKIVFLGVACQEMLEETPALNIPLRHAVIPEHVDHVVQLKGEILNFYFVDFAAPSGYFTTGHFCLRSASINSGPTCRVSCTSSRGVSAIH